MALMAAAFPILPGKTEDWRRWVAEFTGARRDEFVESRRALGVHERTFMQQTPMGDVVIVTLEGDDPPASFARFATSTDAFSTWFLGKVKEFHGIDLADAMSGPMPELVADSET